MHVYRCVCVHMYKNYILSSVLITFRFVNKSIGYYPFPTEKLINPNANDENVSTRYPIHLNLLASSYFQQLGCATVHLNKSMN